MLHKNALLGYSIFEYKYDQSSGLQKYFILKSKTLKVFLFSLKTWVI